MFSLSLSYTNDFNILTNLYHKKNKRRQRHRHRYHHNTMYDRHDLRSLHCPVPYFCFLFFLILIFFSKCVLSFAYFSIITSYSSGLRSGEWWRQWQWCVCGTLHNLQFIALPPSPPPPPPSMSTQPFK